MPSELDPSFPPKWLVNVRTVVYFAGANWWSIVPAIVLLAWVFGLQWRAACVLGVVVLLAILAAPFMLGALIAVVSRAHRRRFENPE
jgi:hypothetical protein